MLPLRDTIRSASFPIVNWILIAANTLVFLYETSLGTGALEEFIRAFGMTPARLSLVNPLALVDQPLALATLFTSQFLHGGWLHLISNMWTLFIFGDNVEDRMGSGRFLVFYLASGMVANLLQAFVFPASNIPTVGASGAIAGILGAYFLLYPRARVITLIPIFIYPWFVEISAIFYLGFWFVSQLFSGIYSIGLAGRAGMGGVAWWAHIGGFIFGLVFVNLFTRRHQAYTRQYPDEYYPW
ncbi:MAG TPA: rhomboid family intramembrane serine protease [Anaerolineales bacterium]|nr:rhomboid family intramembrane serine protease [Anaerolineales bacterium]